MEKEKKAAWPGIKGFTPKVEQINFEGFEFKGVVFSQSSDGVVSDLVVVNTKSGRRYVGRVIIFQHSLEMVVKTNRGYFVFNGAVESIVPITKN